MGGGADLAEQIVEEWRSANSAMLEAEEGVEMW